MKAEKLKYYQGKPDSRQDLKEVENQLTKAVTQCYRPRFCVKIDYLWYRDARKLPFKALTNEPENKLFKSNELKNKLRGAQQLSILAACGLGPSTHIGRFTATCDSTSRGSYALSGYYHCMCVCIHTKTQKNEDKKWTTVSRERWVLRRLLCGRTLAWHVQDPGFSPHLTKSKNKKIVLLWKKWIGKHIQTKVCKI